MFGLCVDSVCVCVCVCVWCVCVCVSVCIRGEGGRRGGNDDMTSP